MLTTQKRKFALALMSGKNKTASAIAAGYSAKTARVKGSQLAKDPECNQVNHLIPTRVLVKGGEITCKILK
ncbi:terminase small subunit [Escherichia coli]|nr:terminase small subunit [Escherichia coli]